MSTDSLVTVRCANGFETSVAVVEQVLAAKGVVLFAKVDHAAGARAAHLEMAPTTLLVFGSPTVGTPLMLAQRTAALDLPLRALVWADDHGAVWLTYQPPAAILARHGLDGDDLAGPLAMEALLEAIKAAVIRPAAPASPRPATRAVARDSGKGVLRAQVFAGASAIVADEPPENGGTALGPTPHTLISAALAACTTLTIRSYADRKGWPVEAIEVAVEHSRDRARTPADEFQRQIALTGALDAEQTGRLLQIADRCPVHLTLEAGSRITTTAQVPADGAAAS